MSATVSPAIEGSVTWVRAAALDIGGIKPGWMNTRRADRDGPSCDVHATAAIEVGGQAFIDEDLIAARAMCARPAAIGIGES